MDALRNSDQSAAEGRLGFSKATSLTGELAGLKLALEDGVRGSVYALLRQGEKEKMVSNYRHHPVIDTPVINKRRQDLPEASWAGKMPPLCG